ncbi:MAG: dihydrofolate reductase [Halobacteriaceae archaeon]
MELVIIAAVAANGVIGADGEIPWHIPADLKRFQRLTTGHPVIMGRRTYESILADLGEPLPDRTSVVLTTTDIAERERVVPVDTVASALEAARSRNAETAFVAGGAQVYAAFLPRADRLELTELHDAYDGDTRFPDRDPTAWTEVARDSHGDFDFVTYERSGSS